MRKQAGDLVALLTPVIKAFLTDNAFTSTNEGMQVFGGHGYIAEWGMEQYVRDARINMIYEGTNTIQALDLLGRKILGDMGARMKAFGKIVQEFVEAEGTNEAMQEFINPLADIGDKVQKLTMEIGMKAMGNADEVGAAAVPYLRVVGHLVFVLLGPHGQDRAGEGRQRRQVLHRQAGHGTLLLCQAAAGNRRRDPQGARRFGHADGAGRRPVLSRLYPSFPAGNDGFASV